MAEDILALKEQRSHFILSANDILDKSKAEGRVLTEVEQTESTELLNKAEGLAKQIEDIKKAEDKALEIQDAMSELAKPAKRRSAGEDPNAGLRISNKETPIVPVHRYAPLRAFKGEKAEFNAYATGMWLAANFLKDDQPMKHTAHRWVQQNIGHLYDSLSTGVPSAGGNLVPDAMSQTIIDLREQYGIVRQWVQPIQMPSDYYIFPRRSGSVTPYWTGEGTAVTASDPSFNNVTLTAKKLAAYTLVSSELSEDAIISIADWVAMDMGKQFAYEEDRVGFNGTGISTDGNITGLFKKILQAGSAGSYIDVATATHNTGAEMDNADITKLMGALPQYALPGSAFFCSQEFATTIFGRLMAAGGGNTIDTLQRFGIGAMGEKGIVGNYLGYPVVASQVLPTGTTTSVPVLAFGNLGLAITFGERRAIRFATDASIKFAEDQIAIKATARLDINVHDLGSATAAGPVVILKGGSS